MNAGRPLPKLLFAHSWLYDRMLRALLGLKDEDRPLLYERGITRARIFQTYWDEEAKGLFEVIEKVTRLSWRRTEVYCYVVSKLPANIPTLLDPLTVPVSITKEGVLGLVTHELVHQNFEQNGLMPWLVNRVPFMQKFSKETFSVQLHIPVCAVLERAFPIAFGVRRARKFRNPYSGTLRSSMARALEIVEEEGVESILEKVVWRKPKNHEPAKPGPKVSISKASFF